MVLCAFVVGVHELEDAVVVGRRLDGRRPVIRAVVNEPGGSRARSRASATVDHALSMCLKIPCVALL